MTLNNPYKRMTRLLPVALAAGMLGTYAGAVLAADIASLTGIKKLVQTAPQGTTAWAPAQLRAPLALGTSVRTGESSAAEITYADGNVFRLASSTTLTLQAQEGRWLKLLLGKLWFKQQKGTGSFKIQTPSVVASISSNEETFEVDDAGRTRVVALDTDPDKPVMVQAIDVNGNPIGNAVPLLSGQDVFVDTAGHVTTGTVNTELEREHSPAHTRFGGNDEGDHDPAHAELDRLGNEHDDLLLEKLQDVQQTGGSPTTGNVEIEVK